MAPRTYLNFDLLFEPEGKELFRARVVDSPDGSHPFVDFALPFDPVTLENLLLKLDPGRSGTRRGSASPQVDAGRRLGGALFDAVFTDGVAVAWARAKDAALERAMGVRLRLHLADAPAIAGLPWELLYDEGSNTFLAQSERTPVVRFLEVPHVQPPLRVDGPLRVLAVISAPTDLPDLDVEAEWAHLQEALAARVDAGQVSVDRLPEPTLGALGRWLRTRQVHVLHFIGHGDLDPRTDDGVLYLCDDYGRSSAVPASVLGPFIHDHDPLRLVVLNACRSASTDASDPYGGMAQGLVQQQAAAVVAMQFPITDRAATAFTREFYGALTDGFPVDQAVTNARKALWAGYGAEWATPTVFLHTGDGLVFDAVAPARPGIAADAPADATVRPARRGRTVLLGAGVITAVVGAGVVVLNLPSGETPGDGTPVVEAVRLTARIDAGDAEWSSAPTYFSDHRVAGAGEPTVWAEWRLGWDADNYYVYVKVLDAAFTEVNADDPPQLWRGDSVSFELGVTGDEVPGDALHPRDRHVLIGPRSTGVNVVQYNVPDGPRQVFTAGPRSTGSAVVWFGDGGYTIEAAVPWSELTGTSPAPGSRFATNLNVSDAVSSGDLLGQLSSMSSNNPARTSNDGDTRADWGVVELTG